MKKLIKSEFTKKELGVINKLLKMSERDTNLTFEDDYGNIWSLTRQQSFSTLS